MKTVAIDGATIVARMLDFFFKIRAMCALFITTNLAFYKRTERKVPPQYFTSGTCTVRVVSNIGKSIEMKIAMLGEKSRPTAIRIVIFYYCIVLALNWFASVRYMHLSLSALRLSLKTASVQTFAKSTAIRGN